MARVRVLVLRTAGINCDRETRHAWELAGASTTARHLNELAADTRLLAECQIVTIPGGFSYGDDIAAGKVFARQIMRRLGEDLRALADRGGAVLGICNGFQVLVKAGLLPAPADETAVASCTITDNATAGFQDRWVTVAADDATRCVFLEPGRRYEMPIAHGEGRVRFVSPGALENARSAGALALRYVPGAAEDSPPGPINPNGSDDDLAGLCDPTGRIFGLMPHPERFVTGVQHPCWTNRAPRDDGDGLAMFRSAVRFFK